ncbi:hypothetical protein, partial [Vacuolonema iberomarrocanum]|uniref:hypothetical protein n=1 Tax=Vacuolonema iberomarrocanum TaxID=3454632 RepID=UPI0019D9C79F|nr:hypothetical protein [filamentous cyanobacterium LEGE 07170]
PVDLNGASLATGRQLTSGAIAGAVVVGAAVAGAAATEAALSRPSSTAPFTDGSEDKPLEIAKGSTERLRLQNQNQSHGFPLGTTHRQALQRVAATQALSLGGYKIFIKNGAFDDRPSAESSGEPWVLIWLAGGRVINEKTGVSVSETWSTLNGYTDSLVVEVLEPTILHAFFVDTDVKDNESAMTVSIERLPS